MKMNWKEQADKQTFELYPEGTYICKVKAWEKKEARTGTEQILFTFTICEPDTFKNKTYGDFFAITEKSLWRIADLINKCGVNTKELPEMEIGGDAFQRVLNTIIGRKVGLYIKKDQYDGKDKNVTKEIIRVETEGTDITTPEKDEAVPF